MMRAAKTQPGTLTKTLRSTMNRCLQLRLLVLLLANSSTAIRLQQDVRGRCVCVLDFDQTLRVVRGSNADTPAPDGPSIVRHCYEKGYGVGIASANGDWTKITSVLGNSYGVPEVFNPAFFSSPAFQVGQANKRPELEAIKTYFNTWPSCMMFFDDKEYNRQYAEQVGTIWQQVDGNNGVAWDDFKAAESRLLSRCKCST